MSWLVFVAGAALSWGAYGALLYEGTVKLGNPLKALLCVGIAYFLIGVLIPAAVLSSQSALSNFTTGGLVTATVAGVLGAAGAVCIIWAFRSGGVPFIVMPLVFGGAPIIQVIIAIFLHPPKTSPSPILYLGFLMTAVGAGLVLRFRPHM